jgi:hypothetical protein
MRCGKTPGFAAQQLISSVYPDHAKSPVSIQVSHTGSAQFDLGRLA